MRVKAGPPVKAEVGLMLASTGAGLLIAKGAAFEAPPPGTGLTTVMTDRAARGNIAAGIAAVS